MVLANRSRVVRGAGCSCSASSTTRRLGTIPATCDRPFAPHDCTGPVVYVAGTHLCVAEPNAPIREGVRANHADAGTPTC
jgi:galactonate dehydratase